MIKFQFFVGRTQKGFLLESSIQEVNAKKSVISLVGFAPSKSQEGDIISFFFGLSAGKAGGGIISLIGFSIGKSKKLRSICSFKLQGYGKPALIGPFWDKI